MADETTLTEVVIPPGKPKGTASIAETVKRQMFGEPKKPPEKPAETKPAEAAKPAEKPPEPAQKERNPDGTFKAAPAKDDPNIPQMREVIKRQQERIKALEAQGKAPASPEAPKVDPRREALLATMSPETRKWYESTGKELQKLDAEEATRAALSPHERALAKANKDLEQADEDAKWNAEFNDWMAGKLAAGEVVDERAMLATLQAMELKGWRFGNSETEHLDQVLTLLRAQNPGAVAGIKTGKEAEEAAKKQADELLRAGGVRPGAAGVPNPQADREADLKALREASFRGDSAAPYLRRRLKGLGIYPDERGQSEGG